MEMNDDQIGPRETVIPEQRFYSCLGCKFYNYSMTRSGLNPIYEHSCKKMDIFGNEITENVIMYYRLSNSKTPSCCPYLIAAKRNDKIDKLI